MSNHPFKHLLIGGTMDCFHRGHRDFIDLAHSLSDFVTIVLSADSYAQKFRSYQVRDFTSRRTAIYNYLKTQNLLDRSEILRGPDDADNRSFYADPKFDAILILKCDFELVSKINQQRKDKYVIIVKPRSEINGQDISSTKLNQAHE